jgi:hypothetical protein
MVQLSVSFQRRVIAMRTRLVHPLTQMATNDELSNALVQEGDFIRIQHLNGSKKKISAEVISVKKPKMSSESFRYTIMLETGKLLKTKLIDLDWKLKKKRYFSRQSNKNVSWDIAKRFKRDFEQSLPREIVRRRKHFMTRFPIESLKYIVAPMVGASELPFRLLCRRYGATLAYTPMINSDRFALDADYRREEFQVALEDRPLVAHFSANNPQTFLAAARFVASQCDAIGKASLFALPLLNHCPPLLPIYPFLFLYVLV